MSAHRYWGIYLTSKSGYGFQAPVGTLQIKEIGLYYTDSYGISRNALTTDLSVVSTTTVDLYDVYPPNDNPLDINDPWHNGLTPINPGAVNNNSLADYCTFPDNNGTFIPDGALLVDFGTFEVRDISSVRIFYGDISPILEGYFKLNFIYSDDGLDWFISGSVSPIGSVSNTVQTYPNNSITIGEYTPPSGSTGGGVTEEVGPTTVTLVSEEININSANRLAIYRSGGYRYWAVEFYIPVDGIRNNYYEIELYPVTCGQNIAPQATIIDTNMFSAENSADQDFDTYALQYLSYTAYIAYDFLNPRDIAQLNILQVANFIDTIKIYYSSTGTLPYTSWNVLDTWNSISSPDFPKLLTLKTSLASTREFCPISDQHNITDNQLTIDTAKPTVVSLNPEELSITSSTLLAFSRAPLLFADELLFTDGYLAISPYILQLIPQTINISDDITTISRQYSGLISEIFYTLSAHIESKHRTAYLYELIYTLVNVIDDYILYVVDTLSVEDTLNIDSNMSITVEEFINIDSLVKISFLIAILDSLNIIQSETLVKEGYKTIDESLQINEELLTNLLGKAVFSEYINSKDFANNPFIALIVEAVNTNSNFLSQLITSTLAQNNIIVDENIIRYKLNNLTLEEQASILSTLDSTAILNVLLSDYISFTMKDNDGRESTYYGWVYNPENHAVTNYDFNFSEVTNYQNNTYLANNTGLYLLDGNQDEEAYIQSKIKTAGLQFGARTEKQIPQVFLGIGGDHHIVTVSVDENKTSYYEMKGNPDDGLATKTLKIGKGLIGNTWQFELVDVDQLDFDLDSLEFYPVFLSRKHKK